MKATCPNCGKPIELLSAGELRDAFGITPNQLQHERERGRLPDPWLRLGNRDLYLRADVERYIAERAQVKVSKTVEELLRAAEELPARERRALEKRLAEAWREKP